MSAADADREDRFNLGRFLAAQHGAYDAALAEIRDGRKRTHWMWFVFPQFAGLGHSAMARRYAIASLDEARAYLAHPVLGPRLQEIADAAVALPQTSAFDVFGSPDDLKLRSTLDVSFAELNVAEAELLLNRAESDVRTAEVELSAALGYSDSRQYRVEDPGDPAALEGPIRTIVLMWTLRLLYFFGAPPRRLHRWYYRRDPAA